ncbi:MAG TPA: hypothetical protein VM784_11645 [Actinomycetota bacterium]|nr:hypothetical protein [Actinomycetota bacterium]
MAELKITVILPDLVNTPEEAESLDRLMAMLASEAGRLATLQRQHGLGQTEGTPRVFSARFSDAEALAALLRASGGWFMRNPAATVTFKMESGKGGKTLQLTSFSPVAMARAAAEMKEYLE